MESLIQPLHNPSIPNGRSLQVALLSNPGSGRNSRGMAWVEAVLRNHPGTTHYLSRNPAEIVLALDKMAASPPDVLAINAGDGTVAAVLTALMEKRPFSRQPMLALLRGGTTNMTAGDIGLAGKATLSLERLLRWAHATTPAMELVRRAPLKVQAGAGQRPLYGMFFGGGAIIKGIEYCHQKVLRPGLRDSLGPALCALRVLYAMARNDHRYVAPAPMALQTTPRTAGIDGEREYFLLMVSALERLFLGAHPFWGNEEGTLHFTAIRSRARYALRTLPRLFWGRINDHVTAENGYWSGKVEALVLTMEGTFTIDGELYPAHPSAGPVRIGHGEKLCFLRFGEGT